MTRETSSEAYKQIEAEGLLSRLRFEVYSVVYAKGPLTQGEATMFFSSDMKPTISPRFAELEKRGVVTTVGKKKCSVTGRTVLLWDVTKNLPVEPKKPLSNKVKIDRLKKCHRLLLPHAPTSVKILVGQILRGEIEG